MIRVASLTRPVGMTSVAMVLCVLGGFFSSANAMLWLAAGLTILACGFLLRNEGVLTPTFLAIVVIYWVSIVTDLMYADRLGSSIELLGGGEFRFEAILISCLALVAITVGMKLGLRYWSLPRRTFAVTRDEARIPARRAFAFYLAATVISTVAGRIAFSIPALTQPVLALGSLHFVALFMLVRTLLRQPSGLLLVGLVMAFETAAGMTSGLSSYQAPFIIIFAAILSSTETKGIGAREVALLAVGFVLLVYVTLIWTAIKEDYRLLLGTTDLSAFEKLSWIAVRATNGEIDYDKVYTKMLGRVGYTLFYGLALERYSLGVLPDTHFWLSAIQNVLMPRFLFPDKAPLNDTSITTMLTGLQFGADTSVNIGYVAQAHVDFGFPLMLLPLGAFGAAVGFVIRRFVASDAPELVRSSFAAAVATTSFQYGENVDKAITAFAISALTLMVFFHYRQHLVWLLARREPSRRHAQVRLGGL